MEGGIRYALTYGKLPLSDRGFRNYDKYFGQLTGSLAVLYEFLPGWSVVSHTSTGFRAPNVADLSELGTRRSVEYQTPNPDLKPEKTVNTDLGLRWQKSWVNAEITGFYLHYYDKIKRLETGNIVDGSGRVLRRGDSPGGPEEFIEVQSANANSKNVWGVESRFDFAFPHQIKFGGTFTYIWGELMLESGVTQPADRIPPANGKAYMSYKPADGVEIRPQIRYAFEKPVSRLSPGEIDDNRTSRFGTDGFINAQFVLQADITERLHFRLMGDNLFNSAYRNHASTLDGLSRNFTGTLRYQILD